MAEGEETQTEETGGNNSPSTSEGKFLSQAEVDRIVQERVGQTKRQTEDSVAKQLGVTVDEAKAIIKAQRDAQDKEKSEAQLAREQADRERQEADSEKSEAKRETHDAKVERALIRALPKDLDDDVLDKKITRLSRLLDVEVGADLAAVRKAVEALKKEEPLLFGVTAAPTKQGVPNSDPSGKPPKPKGSEDAFARGLEKAKTTPSSGYSFLS